MGAGQAGVLVALNLTKNGTSYPNNVLWSNFVPFSGTPDWDIASTTSNAGENTLAQMQEPILDALSLKNRLMVYGRNETWYMEYTSGFDMFRFDRQFDKGVINTNCVVETGGTHYVFGTNDIWVHDGVTQKSIAQGRVRRFIYDGMKKNQQSLFFATHNPDQNEIIFCYVSDDKFVKFPSYQGTGCNRAAIYNYASDLWYFADMPYVTCATRTTATYATSFDSFGASFDSQGGSFAAQEGETKLSLVFGGYANDAFGLGRNLRTFAPYFATVTTYPLDQVASGGAVLYREGIDLDEAAAYLSGYKLIRSIYPQIRMDSDTLPLKFTVGVADHPNASPTWMNTQTYDNNWNKWPAPIRWPRFEVSASSVS